VADKRTIVRGSSLFATLTDEQIDQIVGIATERVFPAGTKFITAGDAGGRGMWIILDGEVEVSSGGARLATFGPGEHIGEMALMSDEPRSADVTATTDTRALQLTRWDLKSLIAGHPEIAMAIMDAMAARLAKTNQALAD
jgi:CRP-like cAMP-binding protein